MGSNTIQDILTTLAKGEDLPREDAEKAFQIIMNGGATPAQIGAFLIGLRIKGETVDEITAGAHILRSKAATLSAAENAIDTCGTGGDMKYTLNISTAVAIVVAGCGVPVAKHGNRSISSASGSSDVLKSLGVNITADAETSERALKECNLCFMMAPLYHKAVRHVADVRVELGLRTIFNLLGPLANPAGTKRQIVGVYDRKWCAPLAHVLQNLGATHAWVVSGDDGMDEITTTTTSHIVELKDGTIREFSLDPADYGIEYITEMDLRGEDGEYNAKAMSKLLSGEKGAYRDIVLLNSAAALIIAGKCDSIEDGLLLAAKSIDSRKAIQTLGALKEITSENS